MRQDMDIPEALPRRGTPSPLLQIGPVLDQKNCSNLLHEMAVLGTCFSERVFNDTPDARRSRKRSNSF